MKNQNIIYFVLLAGLTIQFCNAEVIFENTRKYSKVLSLLFYDNKDCLEKFHTIEGLKDQQCQKLLLSKVMGLFIIVVASIFKLPQIMKIVQNKSVAGISQMGLQIEAFLLISALGVNRWKQNPITVYGEQYLVLIQNLIIFFLFVLYDKTLKVPVFIGKLILIILLGGPLFFLIVPDYIYRCSQIINIACFAASKAPQISLNFKNKSTGQLAGLTLFIEWVGVAIRSATVIFETQYDLLVYTQIANANLLVTIIVIQFLWYWNSKENKKFEGNRVKTNEERFQEQMNDFGNGQETQSSEKKQIKKTQGKEKAE